jgi:hypothetical protein
MYTMPVAQYCTGHSVRDTPNGYHLQYDPGVQLYALDYFNDQERARLQASFHDSHIETSDSGFRHNGLTMNNCFHVKYHMSAAIRTVGGVVNEVFPYCYDRPTEHGRKPFYRVIVAGDGNIAVIYSSDWWVIGFARDYWTSGLVIRVYKRRANHQYEEWGDSAAENYGLNFRIDEDDLYIIVAGHDPINAKVITYDFLWENRSTWVSSWGTRGRIRSGALAGNPTPINVGKSFSVEMIADMESLVNDQIQSDYRVFESKLYVDALNNFKLYNTNLLIELLDTISDLKSLGGDGLVPFGEFKNSWRSMKGTICELSWPLINSKTGRSKLKQLLKNTSKSVSGAWLYGKFGAYLPFKTAAEFFNSQSKEPWAISLQDFVLSTLPRSNRDVDRGAYLTHTLCQQLYSDVTRSRYTKRDAKGEVAAKYSFTVFYDDIDFSNLATQFHTALYRCGLLPTFEGFWDFVPLSFVVDWLTNSPKEFFRALDSVSVSGMIKELFYGHSYKATTATVRELDLQGDRVVVRESITTYKRWYDSVQPVKNPFINMIVSSQQKHPLSISQAADAAALAIGIIS